ncbi:DUF4381 domain-containing protein [Alginatibacterium sediminis]|uniref:DUF4381 domain-containing protein n=1 Tax=Alginatibacterium sediminis TaxID=2164068 RepID=A0A420EI33_9ALTE|nr:DUF4381 domain-containing protein [Alginatibacterium sediminis]RKF20359.1 DUF4381 domain-containing protein [Alginatibacterium sediminis]
MSSNNSLLASLIDPVLPETISMWPVTLGWKVLLLLGILVAAYLLVKKILLWRSNQYRRDALKALTNLDSLPTLQALGLMNHTLKHAACIAFSAEKVASLHHAPWLDFLNQTSPNEFVTPVTQQWQAALYDPRACKTISANERQQLAELARCWLKQHEVNHD